MPTVLIIEDDPSIRRALIEAAQESGWTPICVPNAYIKKGQAANVATKGKAYDAIVVGGYFVEAYIQCGYQIVEQIRKRHCDSIIIGTAGDEKRATEFLAAGADAFVCRGSLSTANPEKGFTKAAELYEQKRIAAKSEPNIAEVATNATPDQL